MSWVWCGECVDGRVGGSGEGEKMLRLPVSRTIEKSDHRQAAEPRASAGGFSVRWEQKGERSPLCVFGYSTYVKSGASD